MHTNKAINNSNTIASFGYLNQRKRCAASLVTNVLRFVIALTFIISGISKGSNLDSTSQLINQYCGLLGLDGVFGVSIHIISSTICSFEVFIGMLALNKNTFMMMLPIYALTILGFAILTCINLSSPLGGIESCGCFGELVHLDAKETFFKNIVLLIVSFFLTYVHKNEIISYYMNIKDNAPKLRRLFVYNAFAAVFPVCISVYLDNGVHAHRLLLYYSSIVGCVIFTFYLSKCNITIPSSTVDGDIIKVVEGMNSN